MKNLASNRRVVITGLGAVTCMGHDVPSFWQRLIAGEGGIGPITKFDTTGYRNNLGGQVWDWDFAKYDLGDPKAIDEATQFALVATREALSDAGIESPDAAGYDPCRSGAALSTNFGGASSWERFCESGEGWAFREFAFDTAIAHVCRRFGLRGPSTLLSISCASGTASIGAAFDLIRYGHADLMVAGGHDSLSHSSLSGLSILRTISPTTIRPFDARRDGTIFGEGAAMVVLEPLERAKARGATIYGEVAGYWQNNNAYHLTAPDKEGEGMVRIIVRALDDAGVVPTDIHYINAHGTATRYHDPTEVKAIKTVLGDWAYDIPVSSIKGAVSHIMGGAGTIEAIATLLAMRDAVVPPTINYGEPDPECDLDCVPNEAREQTVNCALSISAGIGGSNAAVVLKSV
ncbi:MAG: beta-ketoacyl-[acyl-carrier-protein] synthase family protein [Armatimonadota bacterium]